MSRSPTCEGAPANSTRYEEFRDGSGSWTIDILEYRDDLNLIGGIDISPTPDSDEAYRAAVFLEGFIQERRAESNWSDDSLDRFDTFESTTEVEAVAKFLRDLTHR